MLETANPKAEWAYLTGPLNPEGKRAAISADFYKTSTIFFGADTSDEKVARLMSMLEYVMMTTEGSRLVMWGIEGESYVVDEYGACVKPGNPRQ